jgi:hypothetical protein
MLSQILSAEARERRKLLKHILRPLFVVPWYIIRPSYAYQLFHLHEVFTLGYCLSKRQLILLLG